MELRPVQKRIVAEASMILKKYGVVYIEAEMRVGKTLASLAIAREFCTISQKILVVCPKKVIPVFHDAIKKLNMNVYDITVINPESLHKYNQSPYFVIVDEAHSFGQAGRMAVRTRILKNKAGDARYFVFMSGTPAPETPAQMYHQFYISGRGPFKEYKNFYEFANRYINKTIKYVGNKRQVTQYVKEAREGEIMKACAPYMVKAVREEAGIYTHHNIVGIDIPTPDTLIRAVNNINEKGYVIINGNRIQMLTSSQRMHAVIMLSCGVIYDNERELVYYLSDYKIRYILEKFRTGRTAIFYHYRAHERLFVKAGVQIGISYGSRPDMVALPITSYSHGISLADYDRIVFLHPLFSNKDMLQAIRRGDDPKKSMIDIIFLFSSIGIEREMFNIVMEKGAKFEERHFADWRRKVLESKGVIFSNPELPFVENMYMKFNF